MLTALQALDLHLVVLATHFLAMYSWLDRPVYAAADLLVVLYPLTLYVLWRMPHTPQRFGSRKAVIIALVSLAVSLSIKTFITFVWVRSRPYVVDPSVLFTSFSLEPESFPSGHTLVATTIAASLYYSGYRKLGSVLLVGAVLIGVARIMSGIHYPSDVLGGLVIGMGVAAYLHREASTLRHYLPDH